MRIDTIHKTEGNWHHGFTIDTESGVIQHWVKLTDEAYARKFWFLQTPKEYLATKGVVIDELTSNALVNTLDSGWLDFCYFADSRPQKAIGEAIKHILGPYAQFKRKPSYGLIRRLVEAGISFNEQRNMLLDMLENGITFEAALAKHKRVEISSDSMRAELETIIAANADQWEKAKQNPALLNWFVGQYMKAQTQKPDASLVKQIVVKLAS